MADRPILFSGPMVRAILAGQKTQTRRVLTVPWAKGTRTFPYEPYWVESDGDLLVMDDAGAYHKASEWMACPYGQPGDRLWVRETWGLANSCPGGDAECEGDWLQVGYRASGSEYNELSEPIPIESPADFKRYDKALRREMKKAGVEGDEFPRVLRWRPSIHQPRWASRITLEVTGVRVERLQSITDADVGAEGLTPELATELRVAQGLQQQTAVVERSDFFALWDRINGERPGCDWTANPWVWVLSFKRVEVANG